MDHGQGHGSEDGHGNGHGQGHRCGSEHERGHGRCQGRGQDGLHPPTLEFEGVEELTVQVFQALRRAGQLQRQAVLKTLSQDGGHHGEAFCLRALAENDGATQRDIAAMLHLSRPRVTKMLQALEGAGAVARRSDERDRRLTRVFLTPEGRRRERQLHSRWAEHINQTVGAMSDRDRRELIRLLDELSDQASRVLRGEEESGPEARR